MIISLKIISLRHTRHTLLGVRSRGAGITTAASAMNGATRSSLASVMPAASAASSIPAAGKTAFPFTCRMQTEFLDTSCTIKKKTLDAMDEHQINQSPSNDKTVGTKKDLDLCGRCWHVVNVVH